MYDDIVASESGANDGAQEVINVEYAREKKLLNAMGGNVARLSMIHKRITNSLVNAKAYAKSGEVKEFNNHVGSLEKQLAWVSQLRILVGALGGRRIKEPPVEPPAEEKEEPVIEATGPTGMPEDPVEEPPAATGIGLPKNVEECREKFLGAMFSGLPVAKDCRKHLDCDFKALQDVLFATCLKRVRGQAATGPAAAVEETPCQKEARGRAPDGPSCTADGKFAPLQCDRERNQCKCVDVTGKDILGTRGQVREGKPALRKEWSSCADARLGPVGCCVTQDAGTRVFAGSPRSTCDIAVGGTNFDLMTCTHAAALLKYRVEPMKTKMQAPRGSEVPADATGPTGATGATGTGGGAVRKAAPKADEVEGPKAEEEKEAVEAPEEDAATAGKVLSRAATVTLGGYTNVKFTDTNVASLKQALATFLHVPVDDVSVGAVTAAEADADETADSAAETLRKLDSVNVALTIKGTGATLNVLCKDGDGFRAALQAAGLKKLTGAACKSSSGVVAGAAKKPVDPSAGKTRDELEDAAEQKADDVADTLRKNKALAEQKEVDDLAKATAKDTEKAEKTERAKVVAADKAAGEADKASDAEAVKADKADAKFDSAVAEKKKDDAAVEDASVTEDKALEKAKDAAVRVAEAKDAAVVGGDDAKGDVEAATAEKVQADAAEKKAGQALDDAEKKDEAQLKVVNGAAQEKEAEDDKERKLAKDAKTAEGVAKAAEEQSRTLVKGNKIAAGKTDATTLSVAKGAPASTETTPLAQSKKPAAPSTKPAAKKQPGIVAEPPKCDDPDENGGCDGMQWCESKARCILDESCADDESTPLADAPNRGAKPEPKEGAGELKPKAVVEAKKPVVSDQGPPGMCKKHELFCSITEKCYDPTSGEECDPKGCCVTQMTQVLDATDPKVVFADTTKSLCGAHVDHLKTFAQGKKCKIVQALPKYSVAKNTNVKMAASLSPMNKVVFNDAKKKIFTDAIASKIGVSASQVVVTGVKDVAKAVVSSSPRFATPKPEVASSIEVGVGGKG